MAVPTRLNPTFENLGWEIQPTDRNLAYVTLLGRYPVKVQPPLVDAVKAMNTVLVNTGYEDPCDWVGSWFYRDIAGTDGLASGHAYGVCLDPDYGGDNPDSPDHPLVDNNPHVHRPIVSGDAGFGVEWQILEHQVRAIEAIKNTAGEQIWSWHVGWTLGDTMHWQPLVGPEGCDVDWSTVYQGQEEDDMTFAAFVEGIVTGWAEDADKTRAEFERLEAIGVLGGSIDYWIQLLEAPADPEWLGMYARTQLASWGR